MSVTPKMSAFASAGGFDPDQSERPALLAPQPRSARVPAIVRHLVMLFRFCEFSRWGVEPVCWRSPRAAHAWRSDTFRLGVAAVPQSGSPCRQVLSRFRRPFSRLQSAARAFSRGDLRMACCVEARSFRPQRVQKRAMAISYLPLHRFSFSICIEY